VVAVAFFLPGRAKDLSAPPHTSAWRAHEQPSLHCNTAARKQSCLVCALSVYPEFHFCHAESKTIVVSF